MRWKDGRKSENVEDRRGVRASRGMIGGGIGTIILVLVAMYFGVDPSMLLNHDCLAGIWAYHADRSRKIVEDGDIEAALRAASSIGDDRIQKQSQGYVVPESFTHGSSEQRVRWFRRGNETGTFAQCDTFKTERL